MLMVNTSCIQMITDMEMPQDLRAASCVLLAMLCNYNKYEQRNPYVIQLSESKDVAFMQALVATIHVGISSLLK